ncbi:MAG: hypothetical protein ACP5MC_02465 [Candidatus Micrarchaeia archaeon]
MKRRQLSRDDVELLEMIRLSKRPREIDQSEKDQIENLRYALLALGMEKPEEVLKTSYLE